MQVVYKADSKMERYCEDGTRNVSTVEWSREEEGGEIQVMNLSWYRQMLTFTAYKAIVDKQEDIS